MSTSNISLASKEDINFLIEGFIEAQKGGTEIVPIQKIFNIDIVELRSILSFFFNNDEIYDSEYSLNSYYLAKIENYPIASLALWIENLNGLKSSMINSALWYEVLGNEKFNFIKNNLEVINKYSLERLNNYLQCEYLYVLPNYRKTGALKGLLKNALKNFFKENCAFEGLQTMLFKENIPSYNFFSSRGFNVVEEKIIGADAYNIFFGHKTRVSMVLEKSKIEEFLATL